MMNKNNYKAFYTLLYIGVERPVVVFVYHFWFYFFLFRPFDMVYEWFDLIPLAKLR